ncbi:hypothetical protein GCM10012275_47750 [Longimycelium tulufanense]|uniref:O-methyltransferase C-terminal domain-containing protein n=1 Tax=Longimycelium tulufanense TaxID=907463 RepID=A0A8J3CBX5_9PSEU|nr:hypothetical protein GCM10012275_47750 [Longimycelium tulufanense]
MADQGLTDRTDVVVADMFSALPPGGDVYLLSRVIADWNDEHATVLLRRCAEAAGAGNRVLVAERLMGEDTHDSPTASVDRRVATAHDLRMLVLTGGGKRTLAHLGDLAARAGLTLGSCSLLPAGGSIVEFRVVEPAGSGAADGPASTTERIREPLG